MSMCSSSSVEDHRTKVAGLLMVKEEMYISNSVHKNFHNNRDSLRLGAEHVFKAVSTSLG